ncbi:energy transducer TonB [Yoonia sp. R2331]|uniref:energy transducer TonB n=1 Tax=Yoonia sp. R2331 TaxID=3237238 RepID=UPI0034E4A9E2
MASTGTYISSAGHVGLVIWLVAGWGFQSDPLPFEVADVSVVSGEEFAALVAATTPDPASEAPDAPTVPLVEDTPPVPAEDSPPEDVTLPEPVPQPAEETPPPEAPAPPEPVADVTDQAPTPPAPPQELASPDLKISDTPVPRPADRVAPEPVAPPPLDTEVADVVQESATPDATEPAEVVEEPTEATAPEEAATEIVTEAEEPSGAVSTSLRPTVRPNRPAPAEPEVAEAPVEEPAPQAAEVLEDSEADVEAAVAAALESMQLPAAEGPPMTGSEREGFRVAVNRCWNVDPGSVAARVTVEVGFALDQDGKVSGNVQLISSDGDSSATETAFQAARRAILRCQGQGGYDLPAEKYDQWKEVVITFDPSGMRLR